MKTHCKTFAERCERYSRINRRFGHNAADARFVHGRIVNEAREPATGDNIGGSGSRRTAPPAVASASDDDGDGDPEPEPRRPRLTDRVLRPAVAAPFLGVSRATLYRLADSPAFPPKIQLGLRSVGWRESQLRAWLASREVAR